ncbi:hypothetical protein JOQ06_001111 [Pogonophryne albipinna]|uniref:Uncharacterized protein n=1 Tax=Pogonophryne albipinna TaxID=1090488 RepID=A0AAD6FIG1_9TELE|nr:hypothetical protein JOQ06_001111 [Pogonophryne albipinna]
MRGQQSLPQNRLSQILGDQGLEKNPLSACKHKDIPYLPVASRAGHPEVAINSLKNKRSGQQTPAANIRKPRKGDVHFCPNIPSGETRDGLEVERVALLTEDEAVIKEKIQRTFSLGRQEILQEPKIPEFLNKWPALFDVSEINLEFMRLYL